MSSTFFTTTDGDVVLHAGPDPDSKYEFRVHKLILSLASPVFKDMFVFPQPPDQPSDQRPPPIVDILDRPEVLDTILRLIYPGVEPPIIADLPRLTALLATADKYNTASIYTALRERLKILLPGDPVRAYVIACRFGFSEEAKEAAEAPTTYNFVWARPSEDLLHISATDLFQLFQFVQQREYLRIKRIKGALGSAALDEFVNCGHGEEAKDYYFRLQKAVEEVLVVDPCMRSKNLFSVLDKIPDPPPGCKSPSRPAEWYYEGGDAHEDAFNCPFQPMTIRRKLADLSEELITLNSATLDGFFMKDVTSGQ